jgi:hypothetical protein
MIEPRPMPEPRPRPPPKEDKAFENQKDIDIRND